MNSLVITQIIVQDFGEVWSLTAQEVCLWALQEQKRDRRKKSFLSLTNKLIISHFQKNWLLVEELFNKVPAQKCKHIPWVFILPFCESGMAGIYIQTYIRPIPVQEERKGRPRILKNLSSSPKL